LEETVIAVEAYTSEKAWANNAIIICHNIASKAIMSSGGDRQGLGEVKPPQNVA